MEDVPSLADYTQGKSGGSKGGIGKKAARREARRAKAMDALPEEPEASALDNLLEKLPFVKKNEEKEEKSLIKVRGFEWRWLVSSMAHSMCVLTRLTNVLCSTLHCSPFFRSSISYCEFSFSKRELGPVFTFSLVGKFSSTLLYLKGKGRWRRLFSRIQ